MAAAIAIAIVIAIVVGHRVLPIFGHCRFDFVEARAEASALYRIQTGQSQGQL
jgi:hypothetical protein